MNTGPVVIAPRDGDAREPLQRARRHRERGRPASQAIADRERRRARTRSRRPGALVVRARGAGPDIAGSGPRPSRSTAIACWARPSRGRLPRRARSSAATPSWPRCATRSIGSPTGLARSSPSPARRASEIAPGRRGGGAARGAAAHARGPRPPTPRRSRTAPSASFCATGSARVATTSEARIRLDLKAAVQPLFEDPDEVYPLLGRPARAHARRPDPGRSHFGS